MYYRFRKENYANYYFLIYVSAISTNGTFNVIYKA